MPTQRFYNIRPKKQAAIKAAIIRQLSFVPLEKFSAKKIAEELELATGSFSGYFESREDMVNYVIQDYIDCEEKLFKEFLEKLRQDAFTGVEQITEIIERLTDFAETTGLLPVLKNLFSEIKLSVGSSFEYIAKETTEIIEQIVPLLLEKVKEMLTMDQEMLGTYIKSAIGLAVLCYRYTLVEIYNNYENKGTILQKFSTQIDMVLRGFIATLKDKIDS